MVEIAEEISRILTFSGLLRCLLDHDRLHTSTVAEELAALLDMCHNVAVRSTWSTAIDNFMRYR